MCPSDRQAELTSTRDRAMIAGPLAAVFAGAAALSLGVGFVLWISARDPRPVASARAPIVVPYVSPEAAGLAGTF